MDVAGPEVTPFALAVPAPDPPSHARVRVLCPTQAILDTAEAGAVQGLSVGEEEVEAAMIFGIAGRGRPGLSLVGRTSCIKPVLFRSAAKFIFAQYCD